ncbi:MAG: hypothetical protein GY838_18800 [bacterium]|nr:hypothetical protein [bacterium]
MNAPREPQRPTDEQEKRRRPTTRRRPVRQAPKRRANLGLVALVLLLALVAMGWWYWQGGDVAPVTPGFELADDPEQAVLEPAGDRAVTLVFPEWDASGYVTEQRQIPSRDRPGEDLLQVMSLLCAGPRVSGAVNPLPGGTRPLGAFVDPQDRSAVLDFSQEIVTGHPGGSTAETATLTAILRTVALNFPRTRSCVILVEGGQVETLAGHLGLNRPFDPRRWL